MATTPVPAGSPIESPTDRAKGAPGVELGQDRDNPEFKMVMQRFSEGKAARSKNTSDWATNWDFYDGKQGKKNTANSAKRWRPVANIIRPVVQTVLPIMTDTKPGFNVAPNTPQDVQFAETTGKAAEVWWEKYGMDMRLVESLTDMTVTDVGIMKVVWNNELEEGLGDVDAVPVDPENVIVPAEAEDFDRNCPWVIHKLSKPVGEVKRKFPDKKDVIQANTSKKDGDKDIEEKVSQGVTLISPTDRNVHNDTPAPGATALSDSKLVTIYEMWTDDYSIEDYEAETEDESGNKTGDTEKKQRLQFPGGKVIKILPDQGIILESKANPYRDRGKPFVRFIDTAKPRSFYGEGEVHVLLETQRMINKTLTNIFSYMNMMGNPVWILDKNSGVDKGKITNQTGLILTKNTGSTVERLIPPAIPAYFFQFYQTLLQLFDTQSGVHDVTQGRKPAGITAAQAIEELQEAAQTRIRLKERNLNVSLSKLGRLVISRMMQYYRLPRMVKITGENSWPEFFEWHIEDTDHGKILYKKRGYEYDEEQLEYMQQDWKAGEPSKGLFDVKVVSGTSLPFLKGKRAQLSLQLHDRQIIDGQEVLKSNDWPRQDEVLRRVEEQRQAAAEAAAAVQPAASVAK